MQEQKFVLLQVGKPQEVKDAEQASSPVSDDTILKVITAFNVGVGKYTKLVRRLLPAYGGYECKEPESGKFTLSFRCDFATIQYITVMLVSTIMSPSQGTREWQVHPQLQV